MDEFDASSIISGDKKRRGRSMTTEVFQKFECILLFFLRIDFLAFPRRPNDTVIFSELKIVLYQTVFNFVPSANLLRRLVWFETSQESKQRIIKKENYLPFFWLRY